MAAASRRSDGKGHAIRVEKVIWTTSAAEISLLKSLAQVDVVTFMPEGHTAAALARFEATLDRLREMQKAGWVELEVGEEKRRRGRHRETIRGAAARCTEAGRKVLRLLGELR